MKLKDRPIYLSKLIAFKDTDVVKVLVGMRRCGKSSLLKLFAQYLSQHRIAKNRIISMNFESAEYLHITNHEQLLAELLPKLKGATPEKKTYLLLDEIQLVEHWEKAVNALRVREDTDVYLTGSNANMLSSQLATLLSGRYVEIPIFPLSFKEFIGFIESESVDQDLLTRYSTFGGLPPVVEQGQNQDLAQTVLSGIYNTVFVKDIAQYIQIRNQAVFSDIAAYLADTAGSRVSVTNIEKRLQSAHRKTASETIERYIQALIDSFLFYRARRYDIRGGAILQGLEKYYPSDMGIRNMLLGFPKRDHGFVLENLVYNELIVRGYEVQVGKIGNLEVDFVATKTGETFYIQACATLLAEETRERELAPLRKLRQRDGRKLVVTYDVVGTSAGESADDGIEIVNVVRWLME